MGIETIPDELLERIYKFVDDDLSGRGTAYILASVCQRWRRVSFDAGHLWAKLTVSQGHGELSNDLKLRLMRRKEAPLTVRFWRTSQKALQELGKTIESWQNIMIGIECYVQVMHFLANLSRIERTSGSQEERVITPMLTEATLAMTLSAMTVGPEMRLPDDLDQRIWPRLRTFNITYSSVQTWWLNILPTTITDLSIITLRVTGGDIADLARKCPNLITLHLSAHSIQWQEYAFKMPPLLQLKEVTMGEIGSVTFLQALSASAPQLHSFIWRPRSPNAMFSSNKVELDKIQPARFTRLDLDMTYRGSARHVPGEVPLLFTLCPLLEILVLRSARRKSSSNSGVINEVQERRTENAKALLKEVLDSLLTAEPRFCPALRELELHYVPMDVEDVIRLTHRVASCVMGRDGPKPRLGLYGCGAIALGDCQTVPDGIILDLE